jgi:hypothetical protein
VEGGCEDPFGWLFHRLYDGFDFGFIDFGCMIFYRVQASILSDSDMWTKCSSIRVASESGCCCPDHHRLDCKREVNAGPV